jgi:hypothetical protein
MSQVKVVELNVENSRKTNLPPIVHSIRQQAKRQLADLLQNLFNNTDDALFELADRSQSDQHQEMYFDSMRVIRLHRQEVASSFVKSFVDNFASAFNPASTHPGLVDEADEDTDYSLVDQEELEMTVAVSGIVSKVTSQYSLPVMQLTKRLDSLAKEHTITERSNPLGPHALSQTFADAVSTLEVPIKIRIILMKLFERFVMERLGPLYENANRALIDADVLPDLKLRNPKRATRSTTGLTSKSPAPSDDGDGLQGGTGVGSDAGDFGFSTVQSLLAGVRTTGGGTIHGMGGARGYSAGQGFDGMHGGGTGSPGTGFGYGGAASGNGGYNPQLPPLAANELVNALSALQTDKQFTEIDINQVPPLADLRHLVLTKADVQGQKSLRQADDDTVNFVGMLFDYILNDRNLAIPMKALIGRLQIPIVKLAILDKTFFEKTAHPARALLNELSSAGIGWSSAQELKRDALYDKIESIVLRVLNEFADNPDVFSDLLQDLRDFVHKDTRRSVLVEQRVKESETGKARTHGAKLKVQTLINQKASGLRLPCEAGKFISEDWSRVLTLRCVRYSEVSDEWMSAVATLDDLLWSLQPLSTIEDVERRDERQSSLIKEIREGMTEVGCTQDDIAVFCNWICDHLNNLSINDRAFLEDDERVELDIPIATLEEIVLAPEVPSEPESLAPEFAEKIKSITEGTWVEILQEEEDLLRCKLATITQPGNNYIFVNRRGMKVLEQSRMQLAVLLKEQRMNLIDESQVFDRALQSVIGNLRQMQQDRTP